MKVEGVSIEPRKAAEQVFPTAQLVEHTRSYFGPFVDALAKKLGPPPALHSIDGEAKGAWADGPKHPGASRFMGPRAHGPMVE